MAQGIARSIFALVFGLSSLVGIMLPPMKSMKAGAKAMTKGALLKIEFHYILNYSDKFLAKTVVSEKSGVAPSREGPARFLTSSRPQGIIICRSEDRMPFLYRVYWLSTVTVIKTAIKTPPSVFGPWSCKALQEHSAEEHYLNMDSLATYVADSPTSLVTFYPNSTVDSSLQLHRHMSVLPACMHSHQP